MKLHNFFVFFGTGIIVITILIAITFSKRLKPFYYNYIFAYIILGLLLSVNTITSNKYAWSKSLMIPIILEQLIFLFQSLLLGLFFLEVLKKSRFKKTIRWLLFVLILVQVVIVVVVHSTNTDIRQAGASSLILLIFCFFYLKDLMGNKPTLILVKSSSFWIVLGILFSSCIGLPVSTLIPFIPKNQEYFNLSSQIFSLFNISLIILYLFIIKSYLCLKHPQTI